MSYKFFFQIFITIVLSFFLEQLKSNEIKFFNNNINYEISKFIKKESSYPFYGLAFYYNKINYFMVDDEIIKNINTVEKHELKKDQWLVIASRFNVLLIKKEGLKINFGSDKRISLDNSLLKKDLEFFYITSKVDIDHISPDLLKVKYNHLWFPFKFLANQVEKVIAFIYSNITNNWAYAVLIFSILINFILLPVKIFTLKIQRKVNNIQTLLEPKLNEIKKKYDGEEAHNKIIAAHKELGVTPFYSLKQLIGIIIQIPILVSIFNALGEMPQFNGQSFLWIENLAYPDTIYVFQFSIPMIGNSINFLPFAMSIITLYTAFFYKNNFVTLNELKRQKRNLYLMATLFFILFYPFPSVMVFYWTCVNSIHIFQQKLIRL